MGFSGAPVMSNAHLINGQQANCTVTSNLLNTSTAGAGGGGGVGGGGAGGGGGGAVSLLGCPGMDGRSRTPNAVVISQVGPTVES